VRVAHHHLAVRPDPESPRAAATDAAREADRSEPYPRGLSSLLLARLQQRCPYSVEQLSSLLPGRQVISYAGLLSIAQTAHAHNGFSQSSAAGPDGLSPSLSRLGFRSSLSSASGRARTTGSGGLHHKRPSLSGSISSMSGLIGSGGGSSSGGGAPLAAETLDTYTDKVDGLLRKIIRQRRDDDPAVRDWFDPGWGVPVENECTLDGCRLRHFQGLQRLDESDPRQPIQKLQSPSPPLAGRGAPTGDIDRNFALDLGRFSPFDAGSQFHSPSSSRCNDRFFEPAQQQRRSQETAGIPPIARLGPFEEEPAQLMAESTPRLPAPVESQMLTPRPEHDSPAETLYDSEGVVEAEVKWILENFPLPPPKAQTLPAMAKRQPRSRTPPQSPTSIEIRLRQASLTPSSTYSGMSALSRETDATLATTVSTGWSARSRGSTSTCDSGRTDGSDGNVPSSRSSRDSAGPLTPLSVDEGGVRSLASAAGLSGDRTPREGRAGGAGQQHADGGLVSPRTLVKPLPAGNSWRPKTPPPPPLTQLPQMQSRRPTQLPPSAARPPPPAGPPPSAPPPPPPGSLTTADVGSEGRPFAALLEAESPLSLGEPIRLPTGPRQFSSVSVLPSSGSSLGLPDGRSPSPRKGSLMPTSNLEASPDGFRYHRPHQGVLNPYLRKSPSLSVSTLPSIHSAQSASSVSPEASSTTLPRSATVASLASPGGVEGSKIFKIFIPSAERTISVSVGPDDSLLGLRSKIAAKLRRTQLELPDKWSLATAQLSSTREKIVGDRELEALLAGRLRNGDPSQPCVLRIVEA